jgi:hypothetical protein
MLAAGQPNTPAAKRNDFKSVIVPKSAFQSWRSIRHVPTLFEALAGVLVVSYLFAVGALGGALLFYTFNR